MQSLLLNWLFYEPVGHLVEALQHAHGYWRANADHYELHLLLNAATPVELARALAWVKAVYPVRPAELVELGAAAPCLADVPTHFDYVIADPRTRPGAWIESWDEPELIRAQAVLHALYPPDEYSKGWGDFAGLPAPTDSGLPYQRDARLELILCQAEIVFGVDVGASPIVAVHADLGIEEDRSDRRADLEPVVQTGRRLLGRERYRDQEKRERGAHKSQNDPAPNSST